MQEKHPLPASVIRSCLNTHYGIDAASLTFLPLGADINASVYRVQTQDQKAYFIKIKRGHHCELSVEIVELLQSAGVQQIIPPVRTIHGKTTQPIDGFTLIVYPFVDGQDGFHRALTDEQWVSLGKALRQVHEVKVPLPLQHQIRREAYSTKWRESVRSVYNLVETDLSHDEIALELQQFMKKNMDAIQRLVDRAEQLGEKLRDRSPECVLCHSDIHAGNVLIGGNQAFYIVDWDEPILAPKERDLMFIGGGVGNVWNLPHEEPLFYQGYGQVEIDLTALVYYRHERIVEDIAVYTRELFLKMGQGLDRAVMYKHFTDMFAPNGVFEIAFKTAARMTTQFGR